MNTKKALVLFISVCFLGLATYAQTGTSWRNGKAVNEVYNHNWSFGAGVNIVDDSGTKGAGISNPNERWAMAIPFAFTAEYYLNNNFSFNAMLSFNKYKEGKNVDNLAYIIKGHEASYFAFDLATKYYLRDLIKSYKFDPYVFAGFGFTNIGAYKAEPMDYITPPDYIELDENGNFVVPSIGRMTVNIGLGFNVWFTQTWGLNFNMAGKLGIGTSEHESGPNSISNQMQMALGVVYFLN